MRFRDDNPAELARTRAAVTGWRDQNPAGNVEELIAARLTAPVLGIALNEPDQVVRLGRFREEHPDVIIGDGGFGTIQARIPEPNGEMVITRYRLAELLDKLDQLTSEHGAHEDDARS